MNPLLKKVKDMTANEQTPQAPARPPLRKRIRWDWAFLAVAASAAVTMSLVWPENGARTARASWEYFKELVFVLPAVMVMMGLFAVWVDRSLVVKYLGRESGFKGLVLAIVLGTLPTGPLYIAFPLALMLLKKGARVANVMVFLSAWACIKLPLELMEMQFLGWKFTLTRLALTIALVIPMGLVAEFLYHKWEEHAGYSELAREP